MKAFVPTYHVLQSIVSTSSQMKYEQLLQGYAEAAQNEFCCVIRDPRPVQTLVVPITVISTRLELIILRPCGTEVRAQIESEAVLKPLSTSVVRKLKIKTKHSSKGSSYKRRCS